MKSVVPMVLSFIFLLTSQGILSQENQRLSDTAAVITDLSNRISKSSSFGAYNRQISRMGRMVLESGKLNRRSPEELKLQKEAVEKVNSNRTLTAKEKSDSLQRMFFSSYNISTAVIDTIETLRAKVYNEFPELNTLPEPVVRNVWAKANALLRPARTTPIGDNGEDKVFTKTQQAAKFPGGEEGWKRYLERNLNQDVAAKDGAAVGLYLVKVQFLVDKEGNVSNVQAIEVPKACPSCGLEAVKIIKRGPKWQPAVQNGRNVIYQAVQHITFQVAPL